jgi:hypothetical protein
MFVSQQKEAPVLLLLLLQLQSTAATISSHWCCSL